MSDESFIWKMLMIIGGALIGVLTWLSKGIHSDIATLKEGQAACKLESANQRLHVSENYQTKADAIQVKMESTENLKRIHDRIDDMASDIKTLIAQK